MPDFLRDPNWLDVIIGGGALLISTTLAIYFYLRQRGKKKLSYEIITSQSLLTVDEALSGDIKILYKEEEITDVHLLTIKVVNDGNVPILKEDFNRALAFRFGDTTKVLTYEILSKTPEYLPATLRLSHGDRGIVLNPLLLNPKDALHLKFLLSKYQNELSPSARIVGVNQIAEVTPSVWQRTSSVLAYLVIGAAGPVLGVGMGKVLAEYAPIPTALTILAILTLVLILITAIMSIAYLLIKIVRK